MTERAGSAANTIHIEGGEERVYPCSCGETHRGDYAAEDYNHHSCLHDCDLWGIGKYQVVCSQCGASWQVIPGEAEG